MSGPILVVEDDPVTSRLVENTVEKTGRSVRVAATAAAAEAIALASPALIILDLVLPDADGRTLLGSWRSAPATATIPVIVLTVSGNLEICNQCLALGASAFLEKPFDVTELTNVVERLLATPVPTVEAGTDPLTGVASRAALCHAFDHLSSTATPGASMSVAVIDIDRFRSVNDSCGKQTGDAVLSGVADLIRTSTASGQVVGRWKGDQFMALLPGVPE